MSRADFTTIASGRGGASAIRQLAHARRSRTLTLIRLVVDQATRNGHPAARTATESLDRLGALPRPAVDALIRHPQVGAWALRTAILLHQGATTADPGFLTSILAAVHARAGVPGVVVLPANSVITLPSLGKAHFASVTGAPIRVVVSADGGAVVDGRTSIPLDPAGSPRWRPHRGLRVEHLDERLSLTVEGDPALRMPEHIAILDRLPRGEAADWRERISEGWRLLVRHHGDVAAEVGAAMTVLTPLTSRQGNHVSATFAESFGRVAMSLPKDPVSAALTLTHEVQHAKLSALTDLFPLVKTGSTRLLYAPWRRDPRPVSGLIQGAYAHIGVAGFWRQRLRYAPDHEAEVEFTRWRDGALDAVRSLASSNELTPEGEIYVARMHQTLDGWVTDSVSRKAAVDALRHKEQHLARWRREHGAR